MKRVKWYAKHNISNDNKNNIRYYFYRDHMLDLQYIINLLQESDYHLSFDTKEDEALFMEYIRDAYKEYQDFANTTDDSVKQKYREKYAGFDISDWTLDNCLFVDATEYPFRTKKQHWLVRVGNGRNFRNSAKHRIWGVKETTSTKYFEKTSKRGDILWFVVSGKGQAIAFAEYMGHNGRTKTNEELGWELEENSNHWTMEINYTNYVDVEADQYFTLIKGQNINVRRYNEKCAIDLPRIYCDKTYRMKM
jgi:hypothetical protein